MSPRRASSGFRFAPAQASASRRPPGFFRSGLVAWRRLAPSTVGLGAGRRFHAGLCRDDRPVCPRGRIVCAVELRELRFAGALIRIAPVLLPMPSRGARAQVSSPRKSGAT